MGEIPAVKYEKEGQFTVCGYIEERKLPVIAYVTVSDSIITAVSAGCDNAGWCCTDTAGDSERNLY